MDQRHYSKCIFRFLVLTLVVISRAVFSRADSCSNKANSSSEKIPLYIGGMFSLSGDWDGSGCLVAAELALDQINSRADILPDYELKMIWHNTQCDASRVSRALFDLLLNEPQKVILLGPGCSIGAGVASQVSQYWNLITILNSASADILSRRDKYPNIYRNAPSNIELYNGPQIWMMKEYNWLKAGYILDTDADTFNGQVTDIIEKASRFNAEFVVEVTTGDLTNQVSRFKKENVKIIIVGSVASNFRKLLCEAQKSGLTGSDMFWMIPGWYGEKWWLVEDEDIVCTTEELAEIVETSLALAIDVAPVSLLNKTTASGLTPVEVVTAIEERLTWPEYQGYTTNSYLAYTVDAVWTIGLMLNNTASRLQQDGGKCLQDFVHSEDRYYSMFFEELANTNFFGASGDVVFSNGQRPGGSQIFQLRGHCPSGWILNSRSCYQLRDDVNVPWYDAVSLCEDENAQLANVSSDEYLSTIREIWMMSGKVDETKWHVAHGSFGFVDPNPAGTSNQTSEQDSNQCPYVDLGSVEPHQDGYCREQRPFICKGKADFFNDPIAVYESLTDEMTWTDRIIWPGGEIPKDGRIDIHETTITEDEVFLSATSHIVRLSVSVCGVVLVLASLVYIMSRRHVTDDIPTILVLVSALLMYISVVLITSELVPSLTEEQRISLCIIREWMSSFGVTLGVSTLVGKIWLVYKAATKMAGKSTSHIIQLYLVNGFILLTEVACLILLTTLFVPRLKRIRIGMEIDPSDPNHIIESYVIGCSHGPGILPSLLSYFDKVMLLLVGSFISFEVNQASLTQTGDNKPVSACIYNITLFGACGLVLKFLLEDDPLTADTFTSILVMCCTTITVLILIIPMIISDKQADGSEDSPKQANKRQPTDISRELTEENMRLKNRYCQLKKLRQQESQKVEQ